MTSRIVTLVLLLAATTLESLAVGALFVRPLRSNDTYQSIAITRYDATVTIQDHVATTHVDQTFRNELNQQVEATLMFPLPDGAVITEMYYHFNGQRYKASVREKKEAQAAYDNKIRKLLDPALLQDLGNNIFKLQIAPINGISDVRVEITYTEIMPFRLGKSIYRHLLRTTGLSPKPLSRMSLTIDATTQTKWSHIESPAYASTPAHKVTMLSETRARVVLGDESFVPTKDYTLELATFRDGVEISTMTYVPVASDSFGTKPFFLSWVIPPDSAQVQVARSVSFVADVSSSMTARRMDQLRAAMLSFVDQLNPADRFNIFTFSTNVVAFREDLVEATSENLDLARQFIRRMSALGMTNISEALKASIRQSYGTESANAVVFLTDGQPSFGEMNYAVILDSLNRWNTAKVPVYPVTIGEETSISLMQDIAKRSGGYLTEIMKDDSIAVLVRDLLLRLSMPNITDLNLDYGTLLTYDVEPRILPNASVGGRVVQTGRYETGGNYPVTMTGKIQGVPVRYTREVVFGDPANSNRAVARLWARARIDALLAEIDRLGEKKELVDAVISMSLQFEILTRYTALYADPDDPSTSVEGDDDGSQIRQRLMSINPNPAQPSSTLSISLNGAVNSAPVTLRIVDITGRLMAEVTLTPSAQGLLNLSLAPFDLPAGSYLLVAHFGSTVTTQQFIVLDGR